MTGYKRIAAILLLLALLIGCAVHCGKDAAPAEETFSPGGESAPSSAAPAESPDDPLWALADAVLEKMTLPEKVGQLFFVRPEALDLSRDPAEAESARSPGLQTVTASVADGLARWPVGGVVIFGKNIASPAQLAALLGDLQAASALPLFIAADEEGGAVSRLAAHPAFDLPRFPSAAALGAGGDPEAARRMGRTVGEYLAMYGLSMDFAPVADVSAGPNDTVIGDRAFSADPETVSAMAGAMAEGLLSRGIVPVYKHFPGHGHASGDSHVGPAVLDRTVEELRACEWLPYRENDLAGCAVMVGHIAVPALTGEMTPASLSRTVVDETLRGELGFQGLVITDALSMGAVADGLSAGAAAVTALKAGCDVLLMPQNLEEAYRAVLAAAESGELTEGRIDESVRRILFYKARIGLLG